MYQPFPKKPAISSLVIMIMTGMMRRSTSLLRRAVGTGGTVTEDRFNDGADFYRDTALNISGTVIEVTNYYICIENIYCLLL